MNAITPAMASAMDMQMQAVQGAQAAQGPQTVSVPYEASLADDVRSFEASLSTASIEAAQPSQGMSDMAKAAFQPLDYLNQEAQALSDYATNAVDSDNTMSPSEIISLTVQSQKFMFHSQLSASVANRTAEGVQQLFQQQS